MGVPQGSILSPVLFSLKINYIVKSVLKGSEASLFVDDFALCIRAKFFPHAQRLLQLCVNSVQDWISKNGFKFSTSKTVCMHFCNQRNHFAEPTILLDKTPIKVVSEAKFLGVIFDRTCHVNYLRTNCLKARGKKILGVIFDRTSHVNYLRTNCLKALGKKIFK